MVLECHLKNRLDLILYSECHLNTGPVFKLNTGHLITRQLKVCYSDVSAVQVFNIQIPTLRLIYLLIERHNITTIRLIKSNFILQLSFFFNKFLVCIAVQGTIMFGSLENCLKQVLFLKLLSERLTCGTPSSRAASTKLSRSWRRDPADRTWQLTKSAKNRTKYLDSSHLALFKLSFKARSSISTH